MASSKPDISDRPVPKLRSDVVLYDCQVEALEWMRKREEASPNDNRGITGGLLCLTMGMGKTLTALVHSLRMQSSRNELFPTLVVVGKTLMYEWKNQGIEKFYDNIRVLYYHKDFIGSYVNRITAEEIVGYNLVITTYDQCITASRKQEAHKLVCQYGQEGLHKDKVVAIHKRRRPVYKPHIRGVLNLFQIPWSRAFFDESQRFANPTTYTFKTVMAMFAEKKWCLTGTPIRNYDTDIWSQLRVCGYDTITASRLWRRWYFNEQNLREYMFESNYTTANIEMPAKHEHHYTVEMDPQQLATYKALLTQTQDLYERMLMKFTSYAFVLAMFTRLRQVCIAPNLIVRKRGKGKKNALLEQNIDEALEKSQVEEWISDSLGSAGIDSPKIRTIVDIVRNIPKGEKVIIFSMFVACLELVEEAIQIDLECGHEFLDGSTTGNERVDILTNFKEDPDVTVLLVHYKVGGEGLNLIEANHIICIEPWWSPAVHSQGIARAWRRGQTKPVHIHWVTTEKSIEVPILKMCANKTQLANHYLHDDDYEPVQTGLTKWEMQKLLGIAAQM